MSIGERLKRSWNAFMGRDPTKVEWDLNYGSSYRPDRVTIKRTNLKSIVSSIQNQIAVDCSTINLFHVRLNDEDRFKEIIKSPLTYALAKSANIDQTGRSMIRDAVLSMLDEGCVAIVPTVTDIDPYDNESFKIHELRVGKPL